MPKVRHWTTEQIDSIVDQYVNGKVSMLALSYRFETDEKSIRKILVNNGVKIRTPGKAPVTRDPEKQAKLYEDFKNKNYSNLKELAEKYGISTAYIGKLRRDWMRENGIEFKPQSKRFYGGIPIEELYELRDKMKIGEVIYMTEPSESCVDAYFYGLAVGKSYFATILGKYPHHAITDHGCKPWQDIRDAIKRFKQNEHLRERYGI